MEDITWPIDANFEESCQSSLKVAEEVVGVAAEWMISVAD